MIPRISLAVLISSVLIAACSAGAAQPAPAATLPQASLPIATEIAISSPTAISVASSLAILEPGPDSSLASSVVVQALVPQDSELLRAELYTRIDDTLLAREVFAPSGASPIHMILPFEVRQDEDAWLVLSSEDSFGRIVELRSVPVVLTKVDREILRSNTQAPSITINSPAADQVQSGSPLTISGSVAAGFTGALNVRLIARGGRVLAVGDTYPQDSKFSIEMAYQLEEPQWVLAAVAYQPNGLVLELTSREIWLEP